MASGRKSPAACWTCKVRRKKCDQGLPTCKDCTVLELECHYSDSKPPWMDNGTQQQQMADRLKAEVKRNTARRVRRNKIQTLSRQLSGSSSPVATHPPPSLSPSVLPESGRIAETPWVSFPTPASPPSRADTPDDIDVLSTEDAQDARGSHHHEAGPTAADERSEFESTLLMSYLDYAFPILFPFYNPPILEAGRAWLLTLALKHPAFYHNIIGMAAYFSNAVPVLPSAERDACAEKGQEELQKHMQKAVQGVQDSLRHVNRMGVGHCLAENIRLLGTMVQLVSFEVVFAASANWQMHYLAAVDLFDQTLRRFGEGLQGATKMSVLAEKLRGEVRADCSFLSADQAALRFFAALVIHHDVIASTVRETTPKLLGHYDELLARSTSLEKSSPFDSSSKLLNLEDFTGCPNWVVRSIGEISSLNEWKKDAKKAGNLDIIDLVQRAASIQQQLREGNARLNEPVACASPQAHTGPWQALESMLARSRIIKPPTSARPDVHRTIGSIWAHAAEVYLITVLSGWQPGNVQLRQHVAQALTQLESIDNPSWLGTLAWPFCVLGCFATEEQEAAFRGVANASSGLVMFGTLRDALAIMQKMWTLRYHYSSDVWDVAYCLRILGHSILLV